MLALEQFHFHATADKI